MLDIFRVINKYYTPGSQLYGLLLSHSENVKNKAVECAIRRSIDVDMEFLQEAAMLHDIGIFRCYAPGIFCLGDLPYICHGLEGRKILEAEGLERHALVCERHTGAGLTVKNIMDQGLPLPHRDMLPLSVEERLICYADKFFSKSGNPDVEKGIDVVREMMRRHGSDTLERFEALHKEFG